MIRKLGAIFLAAPGTIGCYIYTDGSLSATLAFNGVLYCLCYIVLYLDDMQDKPSTGGSPMPR